MYIQYYYCNDSHLFIGCIMNGKSIRTREKSLAGLGFPFWEGGQLFFCFLNIKLKCHMTRLTRFNAFSFRTTLSSPSVGKLFDFLPTYG